jgi:hypothetical protein
MNASRSTKLLRQRLLEIEVAKRKAAKEKREKPNERQETEAPKHIPR